MQEFIEYALNKFAKWQEDARKDGIIHSVARVRPGIVDLTLVLISNRTCGYHPVNLYAAHYSKKLLKAIHLDLGTKKCFVQFCGLGNLRTVEVHRTVEKRKSIILRIYKGVMSLHASSMYHFQTAHLLQSEATCPNRSFAQNSKLLRTTILRKFLKVLKHLYLLNQMYIDQIRIRRVCWGFRRTSGI